MPRATGVTRQLARYEEAWEAINRLIRRGGSWSGHERNCFFVQGANGRFENVSAVMGLDVPEDGRGLAVWDFDRDGDLDLVLKSRNAPQVRIWRNDFPSPGTRVQIHLVGVTSNRQAIGARVTLNAGGRPRVKEVCAGSGFVSQNTSLLHFGLGDARSVERLEVRWPSGKTQTFRALAVNRRYRIVEGSEKVEAMAFDAPARGATSPRVPSQIPAPGPSTTAFWLLDPRPLPPLELSGPGAQKFELSSLRGHPFLLALGSLDCPRCQAQWEDWARERILPRSEPELPVIALLQAENARMGEVSALGTASGVIGLILGEESALSLGVLLEEVGEWPREIPVPASLLIDGEGRIVKIYRGAVGWQEIHKDAASIPGSVESRLAAALPFPGRHYSSEFHRNDFQLGVSYLEAGLETQALAAFERSLSRRRDQPDVLYNAGVLHQRRGESEKASRRYSEALELEPDFADAHVNLGVLLARTGALDEAERSFRRVLELRGDHAEAWINLGNVELARGRPEDAIGSFARAQDLEPELPQIQKKIGDAHRKVGNLKQALKAYERVVKLAPRDAEAWSNLGVLAAESGRPSEALKALEKAIEVDPGYASAHNNAGLLLQGLGRDVEAIEHFQRAVALAPHLSPPYLHLARSHLSAGDEARAREVLRSLLTLHPDHRGALEFLRRLGRE